MLDRRDISYRILGAMAGVATLLSSDTAVVQNRERVTDGKDRKVEQPKEFASGTPVRVYFQGGWELNCKVGSELGYLRAPVNVETSTSSNGGDCTREYKIGETEAVTIDGKLVSSCEGSKIIPMAPEGCLVRDNIYNSSSK